MKRTAQLFFTLLILVINHFTTTGQTAADTARTWIRQHAQAIHTNSYAQLVKDIKPALATMAKQDVIGLGEGTHGTSEFQTVRTYITRYLCTEKGFTIVCLENSYGWTEVLNQYVRTGQGNLDTLMKYNLLGMWQNTEIKELLQWMAAYNQSHKNKLQLTGMDYSEPSTNIQVIRPFIAKINNPLLTGFTDSLLSRGQYMNVAYSDFNNARPAYKWKDFLDNGVKGYELVLQMKAALDSLRQEVAAKLTPKEIKTMFTSLYNYELAFYGIYKPVKTKEDASRDEQMALMVKRFREDNNGAKMLVWAHNAHIAKASIFGDDNNGGGSGSFIAKFYPGKYYAFATGTAAGTFSATSDRFIVNTSAFKSYPLNKATKGSWEEMMNDAGKGALFIDLHGKAAKEVLPKLPLRFTGYNPTQRGDFMDLRLNDLYDGFLFIPTTQATHVQQ